MNPFIKKSGLICLLAIFLSLLTWSIHPGAPSYHKVELEDGEILLTTALQSTDPVIWVDARSKENFELNHIPGAILLNEDNWEYLLAEFMEKWNPDLKVIVYCDSRLCRASKNVAQRLQDELQPNNIYTLYGGWETWIIEQKR